MSTRTNSNYKLLIKKLDRFTRKYYFNKLIKGLLISIGLILLAFIIINILEYYLWFSTDIRKVLFYGFLALSGITAFFGVIIPLLQIFRLGRVISREQAAEIIGTHFTNVKDKLLNILQLKDQANGLADASLIEASIDQKANEIKLVPFRSAVDLSKNSRYLKYALIPLLCLGAIFFLNSNMIKDSTNRLINNDVVYEQEAPFSLSVTNKELEVIQYEDFQVDVQVDPGSKVIPNDPYIHINGFPYKLSKTKKATQFSYKFNKLQKDVTFYVEADGIRSQDYTVKVIPKPVMVSFDANVTYPSYTGRKNETLRNSGDMVVPAGTSVAWKFQAQHTDTIMMKLGKKKVGAARKGQDIFAYSKRFYKNTDYSVYLSSDRIKNADSVSYAITVIPDLHPTITAEERRDTIDGMIIYFVGDASDDYGLSNLYFKYKIEAENAFKSAEFQTNSIEIPTNRKATSFTKTWDLTRMGLNSGDRLTYYFEVWDNDGVNGNKSARTQTMTYQLPSVKDMEEEIEKDNEQMEQEMEDVIDDTQELKEEIKEFKEKLIQKKELDWEDREQLESMLQKHQKMQQQIESLQEEFKENMEKQEEFKEVDEKIKKKHEELQKMLDELMTDELRELMEKLEEMMEDINKEELMEELEDFEMTDEQMEQELDRTLELFKQLQFEQKLQETIDKLEELAEKQEELSKETEKDQDGNLEEQKHEQKQLNKEFDDIKKDLEELNKMGQEMGDKKDVEEETKELSDQVEQQQDMSMQQMQQGQKQKAGEKQKDASDKMKEMAKKLQAMEMMMQEEQMEEDMKAIRQLLENLIDLSMDQEEVIDSMAKASINTPHFNELVQQQYKLKDDAVLVKDSLVALSKRIFQLKTFITREINEVNRNMEDAIEKLEDRKKNAASTNQQFIMTSVNNLALMLNEAQQQMQQQMAQQMQGCQNCQNPGKKPGMKGMKAMQQQLNDQIKKLSQECNKPGGKKGGKFSKEAAKLAAKQAAIRQAIEKLSQNENKDGSKKMGDLEELAREMEKTEEDLVNKRITSEMLERQKQILDKMLKAEDAEQQRELEEERQAKTAKKPPVRTVPPIVEEYRKKKEAEIQLYKTVPPSLRPYYKEMVERYFQSIQF